MGYGALLFATALTPASIVDVLDSREVRPALTALAREVMAVAAAERRDARWDSTATIPPPSAPTAPRRRSTRRSTRWSRSTAARPRRTRGVWRDIAVHHRKTECDAQFGPIMTLARRRGIAVPHLERLVAIMRDVESGARPQAWDNLARLAASCPE